jgi:hypothetical protein
MSFSSGPMPQFSAFLRVDFSNLREMLRLPKHVTIVAVRPDPDNSHRCIIDLGGLVPCDGELQAEYRFENTTIVTFTGFRQPHVEPTEKT